ncbi:MAG: RsmF rRNA methyltransferase first C-terminal domain-containing protein [Lachnospiraceae bacterium]|nr:RsmF rRNA methyltransferase first C-terminal domain-containing protein [Lachnospiraceae bacterium]
MEALLGEEYEDFRKSLGGVRTYGLRFNPLKASSTQDLPVLPFHLKPLAGVAGAFSYSSKDSPGKHPLHEAGAYYIQDPDAMQVAPLLEAAPGERVLDLCAAPGGKASQLAANLAGRGVLAVNEVHPERVKALAENMERLGVRNAVVFNETPENLAGRFPLYFDKILVDAPCSGEGMFRKNPEAVLAWSPENVESCVKRQAEILDAAFRMLRPGGLLCYSTCTFNQKEDEGQINSFLSSHPDFSLEKFLRLWPHKSQGEGHFAALLKREGTAGFDNSRFSQRKPGGKDKPLDVNKKQLLYKELQEILPAFLQEADLKRVVFRGEYVYLLPEGLPELSGLKVLRPGLALGVYKKDRFEPAHGLAMALHPEEAAKSLALEEASAIQYLAGESLSLEGRGQTGWVLVHFQGFSLGWGKAAAGRLNNRYPKGLRKNIRRGEWTTGNWMH